MTYDTELLLQVIFGLSIWILVCFWVTWTVWDLFLYGFRATSWLSTSWEWWSHRRYRFKTVGRSYALQYRRRIWPFWITLKNTPYF